MRGNSIANMFGEGAKSMIRDMNSIVGQKTPTELPGGPGGPVGPISLTASEKARMMTLIALSGKGTGLSQAQQTELEILVAKYIASGEVDPRFPSLTADELIKMATLLATQGREGFTAQMKTELDLLVKRFIMNGGTDPRAQKDDPDEEPWQPQGASMLDFSSPINTLIKAGFLLSLSPMFAGTFNFYFLSVGCTGAILYSLFKLSNR